MKPKMNYEDMAKAFGQLPFEKEYFVSFSKNKKGTVPKKVMM